MSEPIFNIQKKTMNINFQEILKELEFRIPNGIINLNEEHQVTTLVEILRENGVSDANEVAQKARVYFNYVSEVSKINPNNILTKKIKNPDTGNDIMVGSALGYDEKKPVYKAAVAMLKKAGVSSNDIKGFSAKAKQNVRGKNEPEIKGTAVFGPSKGEKVFDKQTKKTLSNQEIEKLAIKYKNPNGKKNMEARDGKSFEGYKNGTVKAPGTPAGAFNEVGSLKGIGYLIQNPNMKPC
jgi:hypothetical protein